MQALGPPERHKDGEQGWLAELRSMQPLFQGNWENLVQFARLATSRTKTPDDERGKALAEWDRYFIVPWALLGSEMPADVRAILAGRSAELLMRAKSSWTIPRPRPIDLRGVNLSGAFLGRVNLAGANLADASLPGVSFKRATLYRTILTDVNLAQGLLLKADLENANLTRACADGAVFEGARLVGATMTASTLRNANLQGADLSNADLGGADLTGADLRRAILVGADLRGADLRGCKVYGVSAWDVKLDDNGARQTKLIVSPDGDPTQIVDRLDVAQFYYLLLNNPNIRHVINTIGRKGVLILGRFTPERLRVLEKIRDTLRAEGYLPFLFNFLKPDDRTVRETVITLAGLSRFVIADLTNPSSAPFEIATVFPVFTIPYAPIIERGEKAFSMFDDAVAMDSARVLPNLEYDSADQLAVILKPAIIDKVEAIAERLERF
jgi:hypothetical protein